MDFEHTALWKRTLGNSKGSTRDKAAKQELRQAYLSLRQNVEALVSQIGRDCPGLTVHDITHLDALWDVADTITGTGFVLNPAEAFVLGGAFLLHDAGMTLASYQNGIADLVNTPEWKDALAAYAGAYIAENPSDERLAMAPRDTRNRVVFDVLRSKHAEQASRMLSIEIERPGVGNRFTILENSRLRDSFAYMIGRLAHSHHWDIEQVVKTFSVKSGGDPSLPAEWTINELKLAIVLRCADAAHIDRRRSPTIRYFLERPSGVSDQHWRFQNKLNRPSVVSSSLQYRSSEPFLADESAAWWLAFDTARMIDREIRTGNAALEDQGQQPLAVTGVHSIENPHIFSKRLEVNGWRPLQAEVTVSDPVQLAQTLGGINLYGRDPLAPIRELVQNAVDAIRARRAYEGRDSKWGSVNITLDSSEDEIVLHVDDDGIGMSERVLTGPLIDFGRSFWNSNLIRSEFPGLLSKNVRSVGKYGIGFFSVFLLGSNVRVTSKRFDDGLGGYRTLEFDHLTRRPTLVACPPHTMPNDVSTRVSVALNDPDLTKTSRYIVRKDRSGGRRREWTPSLMARLRQMITGLDVTVSTHGFPDASDCWVHQPDWHTGHAASFLEDLFAITPQDERETALRELTSRLRVINGANGTPIGRAALHTPRDLTKPNVGTSVGGFSAIGEGAQSIPSNLSGVFVGETFDVSRKTATSIAKSEDFAQFLTEQAKLIDPKGLYYYESMPLSQDLILMGAHPSNIPCAFLGGQFVTIEELKSCLTSMTELLIPLTIPYSTNIRARDVKSLTADYFILSPHPNVLVCRHTETYEDLFDGKSGRRFIEDRIEDVSDNEIDQVIKASGCNFLRSTLYEVWGAFSAKISRQEILKDTFDTKLVLKLLKS